MMRFLMMMACVVVLVGCGEDDDKGSGKSLDPPENIDACNPEELEEEWVGTGGASCFAIVSVDGTTCSACETEPSDGRFDLWLYKEGDDCTWNLLGLVGEFDEGATVPIGEVSASCL